MSFLSLNLVNALLSAIKSFLTLLIFSLSYPVPFFLK